MKFIKTVEQFVNTSGEEIADGVRDISAEIEDLKGVLVDALGGISVDTDLSVLEATAEDIREGVETANMLLEDIKTGVEGISIDVSVDLSYLEATADDIKDAVDVGNENLVEIKQAVEALDLNVDLTQLEEAAGEIKAELEAANVSLVDIKEAVEALELGVDLTQLEEAAGEIKAELEAANTGLGDIKAELEAANVGLVEVKQAVEALELDVDLTQLETSAGEIKAELEAANVVLDEIKTGIEALEFNVDLSQVEAALVDVNESLTGIGEDLSEIKPELANLGAIKTEVSVGNDSLVRIEGEIIQGVEALSKRIEDLTRSTIKIYNLGSEIGVEYSAEPLVSLNTEGRSSFSIKIKNTGSNPMGFEVLRRTKWGSSISYLQASEDEVLPGESAFLPVEGTVLDGRYDVYIRSALGTTALVETITRMGPKTHLPYECDWTVGNGGDFATIQAALACVTVKDGDRLLLLEGEYNLTSTLTINRRISIVGESRQGSILKNDPTWTDGGSLISVTADGVSFEHMTISQASTNANAFAVFVQKSGEQKVNGFSFIKVDLEYSKAGVTYRANNSIVYDCYFELIPSGSGNRRPVFLMGNGGNSFVDSCVFDHPSNLVVAGTNNRLIHMTGLGSAGADGTYTGSMTISQNKSIGFVAQFVNHDVLTGTANGFSLIVHNNTISETNAFVAAVGSNFELYQQAIFYNNKLTNQHVLGAAPGKGMFFFDGSAIRLTPMPFFAANNELQNLTLRASETDAPDSPAGQSLATIRTTAADAYITAGRNPVVFSSRIPRRLPNMKVNFWS